MPGLRFNAGLERHLTLAALAHCPRDYWLTDRVRRGLANEQPPNESLLKGILVHVGIGSLWQQRRDDRTRPWDAMLALAAIDAAPEVSPAARALNSLDKGKMEQVMTEAKAATAQYATQWGGVRDHWQPLAVNPLAEPPEPWTVLDEEMVTYHDLIVKAEPLYPLLVVDHKTSRYRFEATKWEYDPQLLTQCRAARQMAGIDVPVFYMIDYLQTPYKSSVWSFPATPVWEFTEAKARLAADWVEHALWRRDSYCTAYPRDDADVWLKEPATIRLGEPWPREPSQCQTPWGVCKWWGECFGGENGDVAS